MPGTQRRQRALQLTGEGIIPSDPMLPPPELNKEQAAVWQDIAAQMPPEWFSAENMPVFAQLCRHHVFARHIAANIDRVELDLRLLESGSPLESGESLSIVDRLKAAGILRTELRALWRAHSVQSGRIGDLSTKLRLTNQSRYEPRVADAESRRSAKLSARPWEDWGTQESAKPVDALDTDTRVQ